MQAPGWSGPCRSCFPPEPRGQVLLGVGGGGTLWGGDGPWRSRGGSQPAGCGQELPGAQLSSRPSSQWEKEPLSPACQAQTHSPPSDAPSPRGCRVTGTCLSCPGPSTVRRRRGVAVGRGQQVGQSPGQQGRARGARLPGAGGRAGFPSSGSTKVFKGGRAWKGGGPGGGQASSGRHGAVVPQTWSPACHGVLLVLPGWAGGPSPGAHRPV